MEFVIGDRVRHVHRPDFAGTVVSVTSRWAGVEWDGSARRSVSHHALDWIEHIESEI